MTRCNQENSIKTMAKTTPRELIVSDGSCYKSGSMCKDRCYKRVVDVSDICLKTIFGMSFQYER